MNLNDIGTDKLKEKLDNIDIDKVCLDIKTDKYTLKDIIDDLEKPGRDLRDNMPKPILKSDVLTLDDLHIGDKLQGTVRNVVDFGVFIDIGLHNDGLAHISKLTNKYIKHPSEVVSVGDIVDCYVIDINKETKMVLIIRDITKEIKVESMKKEIEESEAIIKDRDDFFINMSHELKTPLNVI